LTTFRTIDEGRWGARGTVLSILDLLATGCSLPNGPRRVRKALD
jgi:hypothetical protein